VPGCGKKYSSSGGIRYHLRNCEHEGLPQTASSLAQLAEARAKEDAAIKRRVATLITADANESGDDQSPFANESGDDRSPQDASYDEAGVSMEGNLMAFSPTTSPLRLLSASSASGLATINTADVEFSFDLFDEGQPASSPWQSPPLRYQHHQVTPPPPSSPSSKVVFGVDAVMMCLDSMDQARLRAGDKASGRTLRYDDRQVPSSPRSLMSAFETAPDAEEPMFGLFQGL